MRILVLLFALVLFGCGAGDSDKAEKAKEEVQEAAEQVREAAGAVGEAVEEAVEEAVDFYLEHP